MNIFGGVVARRQIRRIGSGTLSLLAVCGALLLALPTSSWANPYPPYWSGGSGAAKHIAPAAWPSEPAPASCGDTCGDWLPYTRFQLPTEDPRTNDPSNGGTRPQNYTNISSSCSDKILPSIYYALRKGATADDDVLFFRWRVEQIANNYATGPSAGSYSAGDPWNSALWTVLFDVDGTGYRTLAAHLDGASGAPATPVDRIFGIWGNIPTQSIDYTVDPNIHQIGHNPTAFVGPFDKILNFHEGLSPDETWANGAAETVWDYGTTRAKLVSTSSCNEYFIDYQIPVKLLDATGIGGPKMTRGKPFSMLFCTSNSLNNPFQKDCALNKTWIADPNLPAPYGDLISFDKGTISQPVVASITVAAPSGCPGSNTLNAKIQDTIAIVNGLAVTTVKSVAFSYYYDANGDGVANDGSTWTLAANGALDAGSINSWSAAWNASSLPRGMYLVGVQALDTLYQDLNGNGAYNAGIDVSLMDDGATPTEAKNRTFSYLTAAQVAALTPSPSTETWYANPDLTGTQPITVASGINACGVAPSLVKSASASTVTGGGTVDFTLTFTNPMSSAQTLTTITDTLPAGFSYVAGHTSGTGVLSGIGAPSINAQILTWSPGVSVPASGSATMTFRAQAPTAAGTYANSAAASTSLGALTSNPVTVAVGTPRLTIVKTAGSASTTPGSTLTYTITYANDSPVDMTNVVITDAVPTGMTYVAASASNGGTYSAPTITWNLGSLASGSGARTVTFQVTVDSGAPESVTNTASITSTQASPATAAATVSVLASRPKLLIEKVSGSAAVAAAGQVTFTINYQNAGTVDATSVTITDTIPAGWTFVSCSNSCTNSSGTVSWSPGTLTVAQGKLFVTLTLQAGSPYTGANPVTNTATIAASNATSANSSAQVGVLIPAASCTTDNYYFINSAGPANVPGTTKSFLTRENVAPSGATYQSDVSPPTQNGINVPWTGFFQSPAESVAIGLVGQVSSTFYADKSSGLPRIDAKAYDYTPGATPTFSSLGTVTGTTPNNYAVSTLNISPTRSLPANHALVWGWELYVSGGGQPVTATLRFDSTTYPSRLTLCKSPLTLALDKSVDLLAASVGSTLVYTLRFSNLTQNTATYTGTDVTTATIVDTLPAGVSFTSATLNGSAVTCTTSGSPVQVTCPVASSGAASGTIAGGASGTLVINGLVGAGVSFLAPLVNSATLNTYQLTGPTATATTVITKPNLVVSKAVSSSLLKLGGTATYTLTVTNTGTASAANVTLTDNLTTAAASYYTYVAGSASNGGSYSNPTISWNIGTLAAGASASRTFQMLVESSGLPAGLTTRDNSASATETTTGATYTSNTSTVTISTNPNLTLAKVAAPTSSLKPGDTVTYTLTINNTGSGAASDVAVTDPIPVNTTFAAITQGSGSFDAVNNQVRFTVGTLAAGGSSTLIFTAKVNPLPNGSTTLTNTGTATASNASTRTASAASSASAAPVLTIFKTGPSSVPYPATTLTVAASGSTTLFVGDTGNLAIGQSIKIGSQYATISAIAGDTLTVSPAITASNGAQLQIAAVYTIVYRNTGTAPASNVVVTDSIPAGLGYHSASPAPASAPADGASGTVTWNIGALAVNASGIVQVVVFPTSSGSHVDSANITSTEASCSGTCPSTVTTNVGGLVIAKSTSTPTLTAGEVASYSIVVTNSLASQATGVTATDQLPTGFSYKAGSATVGGSAVEPTFDGADATAKTQPIWSGLTVPAGGQLTVAFQANIAASTGAATYQNGVSTTAGAGVGVTNFDSLSTTAEDVTVLASGTGTVTGYVYRESNNNGAFDALLDLPLPGIRVTITDSLGVTYVIATDSDGYFERVVATGQALVTLTYGDLPAGLSLGTGYVNPGTVTVPPGGSVQKNTGYINAGTNPDLTLLKSHTGSFHQGQTGATYTLIATNNGAASTSGTVSVVDTLPSGLTATAISGSGWSCTLGTLTCTHSDALAAGSSYPAITVTVTVATTAAASVTNNAAVSGGGEVTTSNNTASDPTAVTPVAIDDGVYTVPYHTASTGSGSNILSNDYGPGLTVASVTGSGGACISFACTVSTAHGSVTVQVGGTFSYTPNVGYYGPDSFTYTAKDSAGQSSNSATVSFTVQPPTAPAANNDSGTTLTSTALNSSSTGTGQSVSAANILTNDSGTGITLTSVTGTGAACSAFPCTITTAHGSAVVQSAGTYVYTPTAGYSGSDSFGYQITDEAAQTASATVNLTINPVADVATTVTAPATADTGSTVDVAITFTNNGPSNAAGVTYTVTLPTGLSGVSCTGDATCTYASGTGAVSVSGLPTSLTSGQSVGLTLSYTAPATASTVVASASIATTTTETSTGNNAAEDSTAVAPPPVLECDINLDGKIDVNDIVLIFDAIDGPASSCPLCDLVLDGIITINDSRGCVLRCDNDNCAESP